MLDVEGQPVTLLPEEVEIEAGAREGYVAAEERGTVAVIETTLTPELLAEGLVRDLTHLVQDVRKHAGLAIEDSIETWLMTDADLAAVAIEYRDYIEAETLSKRLVVQSDGPSLAPIGRWRSTRTDLQRRSSTATRRTVVHPAARLDGVE